MAGVLDEQQVLGLVRRELGILPQQVRQLQGAVAGWSPEWTSPAYATDWQDYSGLEAGYTITPSGQVLLRGLVTKASAWTTGFPGEVMFTLPVGYRPAQRIVVARDVSAAFGRVDVDTDGTVRLVAGAAWVSAAASYVSLDNLSFWAEG